MKLTLLQYNNYFNNTAIKAGSQLSNYTSIENIVYKTFDNINFFKADGITTEQTINYLPVQGVIDDIVDYDYCIVSNDTAGANDIVSRWFILESHWNRKGQRHLTLRRDLRVDGYDIYKNAPMYIERGICTDVNNSAIFNSENINFSQILGKTDKDNDIYSDLLKEYYGSYYDSNTYTVAFVANNTPQTILYENPNVVPIAGIESLSFYDKLDASLKGRLITSPSVYHVTNFIAANGQGSQAGAKTRNFKLQSNQGGTNVTIQYPKPEYPHMILTNDYTTTVVGNAVNELSIDSYYFDDVLATYSIWNNDADNGTYYHDTNTGKMYKLTVSVDSETSVYPAQTMPKEKAVYYRTEVERLLSAANITYEYTGNTGDVDDFQRRFQCSYVTLTLAITNEITTYTYPAQTRSKSSTLPYNIFYTTGGSTASTSILLSQLKAKGYLYDAQVVPYKPVSSNDEHVGNFTFGTGNNAQTYYFINTDTREGIECTISNPVYYKVGSTNKTKTPQNIKKHSTIGTKIRVCAGDMSAIWEIPVAKCYNAGSAQTPTETLAFFVTQTIMPFGTEIWIGAIDSASTQSLNGGLFSGYETLDHWGLIYKMNNSLPLTSNDWLQYQTQNQAYAQSFNREIESLELNNYYAHQQDIINAVTGTGSGMTSAAMTGMMAGGVGGAIAGGVVGGIASGIGGSMDVRVNDSIRKDALDNKIAQHNYSLANIMARPNTLQTTNTLAASNMIWPIIQVYTAATNEIAYWTEYEKYYAWNIGRIGTFSSYYTNATKAISRYIKCELLLTNTLGTPKTTEDTHFMDALNDELKKGGYYYL